MVELQPVDAVEVTLVEAPPTAWPRLRPDAFIQPSVGTVLRLTRTRAPATPVTTEASRRPSFTGAWNRPSGKARLGHEQGHR